ncbi:PHP domain-containing protein [Breznakiella homolactica]|uniref:PHP domain-containing protein n=1 Tax=Breznakiella homolactica TaxID=2798577 RepID=A0A7T8BBK3_9SPIR|nr:PHP domain-containing protein [Breznakiella homolactica]QQO10491.1 PHP domain-containing protein [Breznakiella homolactica]
MIDLHTHSTASDGSLRPSELIDAAISRGLTALALTDHDTMDGIPEAEKQAEYRGIRLIPGIEMEISWEPGEFHLLGLGIHSPSPSFEAAVGELARRREERNLRILDLMHEMSIDADYDELREISGGKIIGRPHFADLLIKRKIVKNREQAFSRYLGKGRPFYAPKEGLDFARAVSCIHESGGIAVLAHPMSLYVAWGRLPDLIADFKAQGLDGIEAWHPTAKLRACKRLDDLGRSLGLYITAGSDFHGAARPDRKLGITAGDRKIGEEFLEAIPPLCR